MLSFLYWLRGRAGGTSGVAEQVDQLVATNLANAQGDDESGKATRAYEKKK